MSTSQALLQRRLLVPLSGTLFARLGVMVIWCELDNQDFQAHRWGEFAGGLILGTVLLLLVICSLALQSGTPSTSGRQTRVLARIDGHGTAAPHP